jgi:hypothetical protein
MTRRLVGYLRWTDDACQPVLEEHWQQPVSVTGANRLSVKGTVVYTSSEERVETFWEGTWLSDPSPMEIEMLEAELEEAAQRYGLEREMGEVEVTYAREV